MKNELLTNPIRQGKHITRKVISESPIKNPSIGSIHISSELFIILKIMFIAQLL